MGTRAGGPRADHFEAAARVHELALGDPEGSERPSRRCTPTLKGANILRLAEWCVRATPLPPTLRSSSGNGPVTKTAFF